MRQQGASINMSGITQEYKALKVLVNKETMTFFLNKLKQKRSTIAKRILSSEWEIEDWCKEDSYIEQWKLEILASMSKYNWAFFLLEPRNLPDRRRK